MRTLRTTFSPIPRIPEEDLNFGSTVLERPPKDDLRVQRWLGRLLFRTVVIVAGGVVAIGLNATLTGQRMPRFTAGWIIGGAALIVADGLFRRMLDHARREAEEEGPPFTMLGMRRKKRR